MEHATLRTLITLISFVVFLGIVLWALSARNFDEAAQLPFADEDINRRSQPDPSPRRGPHD
jgi:cytochrome c oxidase cbb3-type subunit IV